MNNETKVSSISPEELLSRVKTILEKTIKETIQPKPEEFVGVPEVAEVGGFEGEELSKIY